MLYEELVSGMARFIKDILPDWKVNIGKVIGKEEQIVISLPLNEQTNSITQKGKVQIGVYSDDFEGSFDLMKNLEVRRIIDSELKNNNYEISTYLGEPTYTFTLIPDQAINPDYFEDLGMYGRAIFFNFVAIQKQ